MTMPSFLDTSRHFAATPEAVFRAFVDPTQIAAWFGPNGFHVPVSTVSVDAKVGGHWQLTMVSDDDPNLTSAVDATVSEYIEGELLVGVEDITGLVAKEAGQAASFDRVILLTMRIEVQADGDGTKLTLRQGPYGEEMAAQAKVGWNESFVKLDALLAARPPSRS